MSSQYRFSYQVFLCLLMVCGVSGVQHAWAQKAVHYLVEAEDFQFPAGWTVAREGGTNVSGKGALVGSDSKDETADALTVIDIKVKGNYVVWTRSRDYAQNNPGSRRYQLYVNEQPMTKESGMHLRD